MPFSADHGVCAGCGHSAGSLGGHLAFAPEMARESTGFDARYFRDLAGLEALNFWFRARNRIIVWAIRKYCPGAEKLLEIGCGTGFVLSGISEAIPRMQLSGSELLSDGLAFTASRVPNAELFQMDARRIPFRDEFDVVGAFDVLEHIDEDELVLSQMHGALKAGGHAVITVPQHMFLWSEQDTYAHHVRRYDARDLRKKLTSAGFEVERMTSFVSLPLPLMYWSRKRKRNSEDEEEEALKELRIGGLANSFLEAVLDVERAFIRFGGSFPAGGSLLAIGRRAGGP
jgi:SAM-dependent methyltransferase